MKSIRGLPFLILRLLMLSPPVHEVAKPCLRQVFWFSDHPNNRAFPSGLTRQWHFAAFVPDYSDGLTPDSHGIPFYTLTAPETKYY